MNVNLQKFIYTLKSFPIDSMPSDTRLIYDMTGFRLEGRNIEETLELNDRWKLYLNNLNKISLLEEYLTVSEIAEHLKLSTVTIHKILKEQDQSNMVLPFIDTTAGKRIKTSDYIKFLDKCYSVNYSSSAQSRESPDD